MAERAFIAVPPRALPHSAAPARDRRHVDARARAGGRRRGLRLRAGPVHDGLLVRRGRVPISISGDPARRDRLVHTIRVAGPRRAPSASSSAAASWGSEAPTGPRGRSREPRAATSSSPPVGSGSRRSGRRCTRRSPGGTRSSGSSSSTAAARPTSCSMPASSSASAAGAWSPPRSIGRMTLGAVRSAS